MNLHITDQRLIRRIQQIARRERREPQDVIAAAVDAYDAQLQEAAGKPFLLAIAGLGASGQGDVAEHDEEILASEIQLNGWGRQIDDGTA